MKTYLKVFLLVALLVCLGCLTLLSADAATVSVGTADAFTAAINGASSTEQTVINLTASFTLPKDTSYAISGKDILINGNGHTITRNEVTVKDIAIGTAHYIFELDNAAKLEFRNVTVQNHAFTVSMDGAWLEPDRGSTLILGENAHFYANFPAGYTGATAAFQIEARQHSYTEISETASITTSATAITGQIRFIRCYGEIHVKGQMIDNTIGTTEYSHSLIHMTNDSYDYASMYIYEGAVMQINTVNASSDSFLFRVSARECIIYGGTFSAPNWGAGPLRLIEINRCKNLRIEGGDFSLPATATTATMFYCAPRAWNPDGLDTGKHDAAYDVQNITITGGTFTHKGGGGLTDDQKKSSRNGEDMFDIRTNTVLTITGGTFTHSGDGDLFDVIIYSSSTQPANVVPDITVGGTAVLTNSGGTYDHNLYAEGKGFNIMSAATVTVQGDAKITAKNSCIFQHGAYATSVTLKDNAVLHSTDNGSYSIVYYGGAATLTVQDNAQVLVGKFNADGSTTATSSNNGSALLYLNRADEAEKNGMWVAKDTNAKFIFNTAGNPVFKSPSRCVFISIQYVTDTSKASQLNLQGGTFISYYDAGINLKAKTILSIPTIRNVAIESNWSCITIESVDIRTATLAFEDCSFVCRRVSDSDTQDCALNFGVNTNAPTGVTAITFTNCTVAAEDYAVRISANVANTLKSVTFTYNDAKEHTLRGKLECLAVTNVAAAGATADNRPNAYFRINISGTGTVILDSLVWDDTKVTPDDANKTASMINVTGDSPKVILCGNTVLTGGRTNSAIIWVNSASAEPTITVRENATLNCAWQALVMYGQHPTVNVEGGSITGQFCLVYYGQTTRGHYATYNVTGGTLTSTSSGVFYFHAGAEAFDGVHYNELNIKDGTIVAYTVNPIYVYSSAKAIIKIEGGTFKHTAGKTPTYFIRTNWVNPSKVTQADLDAMPEVKLHITDGDFSGYRPSVAFIGLGSKATLSECIIENVTITIPKGATFLEAKEDGVASLTATLVFNKAKLVGDNEDIFTFGRYVNITIEATDTVFQTTDTASTDSTVYADRGGRAFVVTETAILYVTLNNCTYEGVYSLFYHGGTSAEASTLTVNGGTYRNVATYARPSSTDGSYYNYYQHLISCFKAPLLVVNATGKATFENPKGAVFYASGVGGADTRDDSVLRVTMTDCKIQNTVNTIEATASPTVYFDVYSGEYTTTSNNIYIGAGTVFVSKIYGGKFVSTGGRAVQVGAMHGSVQDDGTTVYPFMDIYGGIFTSTGAGVLHIGNNAYGYLVVRIYGGYFGGGTQYLMKVMYNANVTVYGGTFNYTGASGSAICAGEYDLIANTNNAMGFITVNGGAFRASNSANTSPLFIKTTKESGLTLKSCVATSHGNLYTQYTQVQSEYNNDKNASLSHVGAGTMTAYNALDLHSGAQLRLVKNGQGLRFVTTISKAAYDHYASLAAKGTTVTYGTLIFPAQYMQWLEEYTKEYTQEALERLGLQFLRIVATSDGFKQNADGSYTMKAAVAGILEENIDMEYTALSYVMYYMEDPNGGEPIRVYQYSGHDFEKHERSMYQVTRAAANDISENDQGIYNNQIESTTTGNGNIAYVGKYSPYNAEQWELIAEYWKWNSTTSKEVKTIDLYMIAGQSNAAGYSALSKASADFKATHSGKTFSNIYYVGGMPNWISFGNGCYGKNSDGSNVTFGKVVNDANVASASSFTKVFFGIGANLKNNGKNIGAEYGMATILESTYNATTGKEAAIIKYAIGSTTLTDDLSSGNERSGNWASPSYLAAKGSKHNLESGNQYNALIYHVRSAVEFYRSEGYIVNIKGVFWMQGEDDKGYSGINGSVTTLGSYRNMFKYLVEDMRADFYEMLPHSDNVVEFYVGEIASSAGLASGTSTQNTNFIAMQRDLVNIGLPGIHIIGSSTYNNKVDNWHWTPEDMFAIGKLVGNAMATYSKN